MAKAPFNCRQRRDTIWPRGDPENQLRRLYAQTHLRAGLGAVIATDELVVSTTVLVASIVSSFLGHLAATTLLLQPITAPLQLTRESEQRGKIFLLEPQTKSAAQVMGDRGLIVYIFTSLLNVYYIQNITCWFLNTLIIYLRLMI